MSDDPADRLRSRDTIKVPAVLVLPGQDRSAALRGTISDPVRMPVRIVRRGGGQQGGASGQSQVAAATSQPGAQPANGQAGDPNIPVGPSGIPSTAPRRTTSGGPTVASPQAAQCVNPPQAQLSARDRSYLDQPANRSPDGESTTAKCLTSGGD